MTQASNTKGGNKRERHENKHRDRNSGDHSEIIKSVKEKQTGEQNVEAVAEKHEETITDKNFNKDDQEKEKSVADPSENPVSHEDKIDSDRNPTDDHVILDSTSKETKDDSERSKSESLDDFAKTDEIDRVENVPDKNVESQNLSTDAVPVIESKTDDYDFDKSLEEDQTPLSFTSPSGSRRKQSTPTKKPVTPGEPSTVLITHAGHPPPPDYTQVDKDDLLSSSPEKLGKIFILWKNYNISIW